MREALFIKKNKDRWLKHQQSPSTDPDEIASDFTQLVDDLAYAKTFYPSGKVTGFINSHASRIYLDIYRNRKEDHNRLWYFFKYDVPLTIRRNYKTVLFAVAFFLLFFIIGYFVSAEDESGARLILGDDYVRETKENIKKGNPFGIYEQSSSFYMWIRIMLNNLIVAFRAVGSGIFAGLPTLYISAQNGVMVGGFDQLFVAHGLGIDFWLVVFVHGALEITAIVLSTAAGMMIGKSFLFPGTIRRIDALKNGAKDGVKLMIGLVPVLALAAFFESYITRLYNDLSVLTTLVFALSVLFVIGYFIIYPVYLGRKMPDKLSELEI